MKKIIIALLLLSLACFSYSATVSLTWVASPTPNVSYVLYRNGTAIANVAGLAVTDANPPMSTVTYYVTAVSQEGVESAPSNDITLNLNKPGAPASLKASFNR